MDSGRIQAGAPRGGRGAWPARRRSRVRALAAHLALAVCLAGASPLRAQQRPTSRSCIACHTKQKDARLADPARTFERDIHAEKGLGCLDCHGSVQHRGADPRDISPQAGFLTRPSRLDIPALCGRCHSDAEYMKRFNPMLRVDQLAEYRTSVHGERLLGSGDTLVATCVDCHPAHRIRPPSDPASSVAATHVAETCGHCHADPRRMSRYEIPTDQLRKWRVSVHGVAMLKKGDTSAPTCNDCHGNHGAAPPGVGSVRNVCGQCHSLIGDLFDQSGHRELFEKADLPGCVTCHSNHAIVSPTERTLALRAETVCPKCHQPGDTALAAFPAMRTLIDSLRATYAAGEGLLAEAQNMGMEVSQAQFELTDATNALTKARTAIHSFQVAAVAKEADAGLAVVAHAEDRGHRALAEHRFRRIGLAISVVVILALVSALALKLRAIERRQAARRDAVGYQ